MFKTAEDKDEDVDTRREKKEGKQYQRQFYKEIQFYPRQMIGIVEYSTKCVGGNAHENETYSGSTRKFLSLIHI